MRRNELKRREPIAQELSVIWSSSGAAQCSFSWRMAALRWSLQLFLGPTASRDTLVDIKISVDLLR